MNILRQWKTMGLIGLRLVMALTAIVALAPPALGDDWRPFRGHADEMLTGAEPVDDDCLKSCQVTAVGAGRATHLGRFTRLACGVRHADGSVEATVEFTAANGDTLCAEGKVEPPIPGPTGRPSVARTRSLGGPAGSATRREGRILWE